MGPDQVDADLNTQDYSDPAWWKPVGPTDYFPQGLNITTSPSVSVAAVMVLNDVESDVSATLMRATVDAANLTVLAIEQAAIRAEADVTATSAGGSSFTGVGFVLAAGGIIATNRVLGGATAGVLLSSLDIAGDITVRAELLAEIEAQALVAIDGAGNAFGLTLAFNTIGWEPTNVFFALIEALIGDPVIGENTAFGAERPANATAVIVGSGVSAGGELAVSAEAAASITAYLSNEATSFPAALFGTVGVSINGGVASNRVSSGATAKIDGAAIPTYTQSNTPSSAVHRRPRPRAQRESLPVDRRLARATGRQRWTRNDHNQPLHRRLLHPRIGAPRQRRGRTHHRRLRDRRGPPRRDDRVRDPLQPRSSPTSNSPADS